MRLKIATWNVNSIRTRLPHVLAWLETAQPDVLCLQETKVTDDKFPLSDFECMGFKAVFHGQAAYNGVAILSRLPMENVVRGLPDQEDLEGQTRVISATISGVRIVNVYAPQGTSPDSPKFDFKRRWYEALQRFVQERCSVDELLLVCGDLNIAPADIDVYDPVACAGQCMFHPDEHVWLKRLTSWGLVDAVRTVHPEKAQFYSWWDYRMNSYKRNKGMRIDHVLVTKPLMEKCVDAGIDTVPREQVQPSDHVPVWVVVEV